MKYMQMSPSLILRFGTYVETAAPLFSWPFLHRIVLPTLVEAQTGKLSLPHGVHKVTAVCPAQVGRTLHCVPVFHHSASSADFLAWTVMHAIRISSTVVLYTATLDSDCVLIIAVLLFMRTI